VVAPKDSNDSNQKPSFHGYRGSGEIDLRDAWRAFLLGKGLFFGCVFVLAIASVFYANSLPNLYKSTAVLSPTESSGSGLRSIAGQLGGLASFAGLNLKGGGPNKTVEALEILQSWDFVEEFILDEGIAPEVLAVTGWSPDGNRLEYNTEIYNPKTKAWLGETQPSGKKIPSSWRLYRSFMEFFTVSEDKSSGFVKLSIEYYSPTLSKQWVDSIVRKINHRLQLRDAKQAERNIAFLKQQVEQTRLTSMQSVFYSLIEEQTKTLMLAKGADEYVFKTISEARIPENRSKPNRSLIVVLGCIFGGLLGIFLALFRGMRSLIGPE